jgi:hypothetical protein
MSAETYRAITNDRPTDAKPMSPSEVRDIVGAALDALLGPRATKASSRGGSGDGALQESRSRKRAGVCGGRRP